MFHLGTSFINHITSDRYSGERWLNNCVSKSAPAYRAVWNDFSSLLIQFTAQYLFRRRISGCCLDQALAQLDEPKPIWVGFRLALENSSSIALGSSNCARA